jgi:hypothetical protein
MRGLALLHAACIVAIWATAGCGAAVTAQVDTADQSAGVTVDGWGLEASCKAGHICVRTPLAPVCFPVPAKLCAWI